MKKQVRRPYDPIPPQCIETVGVSPYGGVTYFAEDPMSHQIKIGTTYCSRLMVRMRALEHELGYPLKLLAITRGGRPVEKAYHRKLAADRDHKEWFLPSRQVLDCIDGALFWQGWEGF